ncbi:MAG: hypothetical protein CMH83_10835 [Nocardioides sp.]|nr:hypothetical protein [Nocardioides sp.]
MDLTRRPSRTARLVVEGVKALTVVAISAVAVSTAASGAATGTSAASAPEPATAASALQAKVDRLMDQHTCSSTGFGPDVIPASALVLRAQRVTQVSFDDGWAVYTGDSPGTLLAVCRGALPS